MKTKIFIFFIFVSSLLYAQENEECMVCHKDKESGAPLVNSNAFGKSIHGNNLCISCHSDIKELPHNEKLKPVSCKDCHRIESEIYLNSDHGKAQLKGINEAATCKACHGSTHTILNSRNPKSPVYHKNIPDTCTHCHGNSGKMEKFHLTQKEPYKSYRNSIHGQALKNGEMNAAVCTDCHGSHNIYGSSNSMSKIFHKNIPVTCSKCHENVFKVYERSIHGVVSKAGVKEAPVCIDCHGEHTIRAVKDKESSVYIGAITKTCSGCHASEKIVTKFGLPADRVQTYLDSFHGLSGKAGDLRVANCASCHGFHDILMSDNKLSSINKVNLPKTCGKCHPGAGAMLASGSIHTKDSKEKNLIIYYVKIFYISLILLTIGGMIFHNAIHFLKNLREHYKKCKKEANDKRMSINERIQHFGLLICFSVLAYTGFAVKYPESWWAYPFRILEEGSQIRSEIHHWTAFIFILFAIFHVFYLVFTKAGRKRVTQLFPVFKDITDAFKFIGYNIGLCKEKPQFREYNYMEKFEYWALIWGSIIMIVTGILLLFENITLKYLPLWITDLATLIHFYEAILATVAIIIWHFYWTIFDPEIYPMSWQWITGKKIDNEKIINPPLKKGD
ncbi:MAG: cytochrome b/b6 domain-containing protein [Candidatus Firestonebacteria bacterium]